jgi:signal peptidase I
MAAVLNSAESGPIGRSLRSKGRACLRVFGNSMRPWIRPGDTLLIVSETPVRLRVGEVVLVWRAGAFCAHRIVGRVRKAGQLSLVTQGDAFPEPDLPVLGDEVLGRVVAIKRGRRWIKLTGLPHRLLGCTQAALSVARRWWHPPARTVKRWLFPARPGSRPAID